MLGALVLLLLLVLLSAEDDLSLALLTSFDTLAAELSPFELLLFLMGFFKAALAIGLNPAPLLFPRVELVPVGSMDSVLLFPLLLELFSDDFVFF